MSRQRNRCQSKSNSTNRIRWTIGSRMSVNEHLEEELHKPVNKRFRRRKVCEILREYLGADSAEMGSLPSKNKKVKYFLCVIDVFTRYEGKTVLNAFIETVNESNHKPNKLWVYQGREFYNKLMQVWLDNNDIWMYSTHNKCKSVIGERSINTLKAKIY